MITAALGDIVGNLPAMKAVLAALEKAGIQSVVNVGSSVGVFPWPKAVIEQMQVRRILSVQGELDRAVARLSRKRASFERRLSPEAFRAVTWTHDEIRGEHLEFLLGLPKNRAARLEGISVMVCHGTPSSQSNMLDETTSEDRFRRVREMANSDVVVCGRSRRPFSKIVDGTLFVNPGSVGRDIETGRAEYAVIDTETEPWTAILCQVEYDTAEVTSRLLACGLEVSE